MVAAHHMYKDEVECISKCMYVCYYCIAQIFEGRNVWWIWWMDVESSILFLPKFCNKIFGSAYFTAVIDNLSLSSYVGQDIEFLSTFSYYG